MRKNAALGIPDREAQEALRAAAFEKCSEVVPVKLPLSIAEYVKRHGGSRWIREAVLLRLNLEAWEAQPQAPGIEHNQEVKRK